MGVFPSYGSLSDEDNHRWSDGGSVLRGLGRLSTSHNTAYPVQEDSSLISPPSLAAFAASYGGEEKGWNAVLLHPNSSMARR